MKKNPIEPHTDRELFIEPGRYKCYMLVTPTHIYVGEFSFYQYATPGAVLLSNSGDWFSALKPNKKNNSIFLNRKIVWRSQTKRSVPAWIKAMSLILLD